MCYIINFLSNGKIELKKKLLKHKVILVASIISFGVMLVSLYYYNTRIGLTLITYIFNSGQKIIAQFALY